MSMPEDLQSEIRRRLLQHGPLYGGRTDVPWMLSPSWFEITRRQFSELEQLGSKLRSLLEACSDLYAGNEEFRKLVNLNKPKAIIDLQSQEGAKLPLAVRPDIVITAEGFKIIEIETIIGGIALSEIVKDVYSSLIPVSGAAPGSAVVSLINALRELPRDGREERAILASPYDSAIPGLKLLSGLCKRQGFEAIAMTFEELTHVSKQFAKIVWRQAEVEDFLEYKETLPEIGFTPPLKKFLEEKGWLALLHNPRFESYWREKLGDDYDYLTRLIAKTWLLKDGYMPPVDELKGLSSGNRQYVSKLASGWGSKSFVYWAEKTTKQWKTFLSEGQSRFDKMENWYGLYVLQEYCESLKYNVPVFVDGQLTLIEGLRVRLSPYYFFRKEKTEMGSISVILRKSRKVHGATDSLRLPLRVV